MSPLDRSDPMPLWAQIEVDLRRRLEAGEFEDGFPTDSELTTEYEVSRHTVREAVRRLNRGGLLRRERGRRTTLNRAEFEQSLGTLYSLFQTVEASGVAQHSELVRLEIVGNDEAAGHLELDPGTGLVLVERVRWAGSEPLAIDRAWLPREVGEPLMNVDFSRAALYDRLAEVGSPVPNHGWERLSPVVPPAEDAARLGLEPGEAAFSLERLGRRDDRAVEWRTTTIRGDRYRFVTEWAAGRRSSLRPSAEPEPGRDG